MTIRGNFLFRTLTAFILLFSLSSLSFSQEEETVEKEEIKVESDKFLTIPEKRAAIYLKVLKQVKFTYKDILIKADKITYYEDKGIVEAEGNVTLKRGDQFIATDKLRYDLKTKKGVATFAASYAEPWYGWGQKIVKVTDTQYEIENGYVTTCDYIKPHWKIKVKKATLYANEKIVARNAVIYVGKVPIFYWPKYVHSLKEDRSPFNVVVGRNHDWGFYILTSYNMFFRNVKPSIHLDYRQKNKWAAGADVEYQTSDEGRGLVTTYYANDKHRELPSGEIVEDSRYRAKLKHIQPLWKDTTATLEVNKLSDIDVIDDFFRDEYEKEVQPETFLNITKYHPDYIINLLVKKRINDFYDVVERLPELSFRVRDQQMFNTPFYYESNSSIANLKRQFANDAEPSYDSFRFDTFHKFSYPKKYFGWLTAVPRLGVRETYYSHGVEEDDLFRTVVSTELEFFTKIFKIWDVENRKYDIRGLRHVVEPNITYFYTPEPNVTPDELLQFDKIDQIDRENKFRLGVRNKLQTKRYGSNWDLIDFNTYTYFFPEENEEGRDFSDIFFDMEIRPSDHFLLDFDAQWDQYDAVIENFNTQLTIFQQDLWAVNLEYRFRNEESNLIASEIYYKISSDWAVKLYERYQFEQGDLEETEVNLFKDLHDWVFSINYKYREEEHEFWILFYLKGYPNVRISSGH